MKRILVHGILLGMVFGAMSCRAQVVRHGTGGAAASGSTTSQGSSSSSGPSDPAACVALTDQASCEAAGCLYMQGLLFAPGPDGKLACVNGKETHVCTYYVDGPLQSVEAWKRDTAEGRITIGTGIVVPPGVAGFQLCHELTNDPCTCFP